MRWLGHCLGLLAAIVPVSASAAEDGEGEETAYWRAYYDVASAEEAMIEPGWMVRASIVDDWGVPMGLVTLLVPRDRSDGAWMEFQLPKDADLPAKSFDAFLEDDARFRLLGELVSFLDAPDVDTRGDPDPDGVICIHYWGADFEFAIDGKVVRELPSLACYRNEELFDFAMALTEAIHAELPDCRNMQNDSDEAIARLRECALLTGDVALAGRHFDALEDIHQFWPDRSLVEAAARVEWDRSGIGGDDGLPFDEGVYVEVLAIEGLPQGEVEVRAQYREYVDEKSWQWDAREIWAFGPEGEPQLVSLTVGNPHRIGYGGD
jgi:hypothetical protein